MNQNHVKTPRQNINDMPDIDWRKERKRLLRSNTCTPISFSLLAILAYFITPVSALFIAPIAIALLIIHIWNAHNCAKIIRTGKKTIAVVKERNPRGEINFGVAFVYELFLPEYTKTFKIMLPDARTWGTYSKKHYSPPKYKETFVVYYSEQVPYRVYVKQSQFGAKE